MSLYMPLSSSRPQSFRRRANLLVALMLSPRERRATYHISPSNAYAASATPGTESRTSSSGMICP